MPTDKDSISSQLQIVEEIKLHLTQQLSEKNKQLEECQSDTQQIGAKLTETQQQLSKSLQDLEKEKGETYNHSVKRARTEVMCELKSIQEHIQGREWHLFLFDVD